MRTLLLGLVCFVVLSSTANAGVLRWSIAANRADRIDRRAFSTRQVTVKPFRLLKRINTRSDGRGSFSHR